MHITPQFACIQTKKDKSFWQKYRFRKHTRLENTRYIAKQDPWTLFMMQGGRFDPQRAGDIANSFNSTQLISLFLAFESHGRKYLKCTLILIN
jgi:hypothetical protein